MKKKQIRKLAQDSYTNGTLDAKKVSSFTRNFKRAELKEYIKFLKNIENDKRVTVVAAKALENKQLIADFKKIFPDKKIIMKEDKSLILGVKIINKDTIFDFNLKNTLENIVEHITYG